jgi:hypothetical protein
MHTVYFEQIHPLYYILLVPLFASPFSNTVWWVSLCYVHIHMYIYIKHFHLNFMFKSSFKFTEKLSRKYRLSICPAHLA